MLNDLKYQRAMRNAEFLLFKLAGAKEGDNVVIIADGSSFENARLLAACAKKNGLFPFIADVDSFAENEYRDIRVMEPLRQAILHSDITFMATPQNRTSFRRYLGSRKEADATLLGHSKRYTVELGGLTEWELNEEEVFLNRDRAQALFNWLKSADAVRVTTEKGTDLTVKVGSAPDGMYPVLGILPFYSEVAVVPSMGSVNGVVVADGATERAYGHAGFPIRPNIPGHRELYREPMRMVYKDSMLVEFTGDPEQVERLTRLMAEVDPKPDLCDELGIVTTTSQENDTYGWGVDGSHQTHCVHVAIGNNHERGTIIHSSEHIDFDIYNPTVAVDGQVIYQDGKYNDELILAHK